MGVRWWCGGLSPPQRGDSVGVLGLCPPTFCVVSTISRWTEVELEVSEPAEEGGKRGVVDPQWLHGSSNPPKTHRPPASLPSPVAPRLLAAKPSELVQFSSASQ